MKCQISDDNIMIDVVDQMYESDWFLEETMMAWKDTQDSQKTWVKCRAFFKAAYIARKRYSKTNEQTNESLKKVTVNDIFQSH